MKSTSVPASTVSLWFRLAADAVRDLFEALVTVDFASRIKPEMYVKGFACDPSGP